MGIITLKPKRGHTGLEPSHMNRHVIKFAVGNMVIRSNSHLLFCIRQFTAIVLILMILTGTAGGQGADPEFRKRIGDPGQVPNFHNFSTPSMPPGTTGQLEFTITNRYYFNTDNTMTNVRLKVNIYEYSTLEDHKAIEDISNAPKITGGGSALLAITDKSLTAEFYWPILAQNQSITVTLDLKSYPDTPEGRYFIWMHLNFSFSGIYLDMKSRGHFTDEQWARAGENITTEVEDRLIVGRLDMDELGVDGVVPDTSFRVLEPIALWPFFTCIGLAVTFLILAVVFFYMDEKGKFPRVKAKIDRLGEKIHDIRHKRI